MKWAFAALALLLVATPADAQWRRRRPCASNGMSCEPGPCCRGTKCEGNVCRKPEKDWSDGPKPGEWTPDNPRPLAKEEKKGK
jgi:hypothetical protein